MKRFRITFILVFVAVMIVTAWTPYYLTYSKFQNVPDADRAPSEVGGIVMLPRVKIGVPSYFTAAPNTPLRTLFTPRIENGNTVSKWTFSSINLMLNLLLAFAIAFLGSILVFRVQRKKPSVEQPRS